MYRIYIKNTRDGQIANQISVPNHKSLDRKIVTLMSYIKLNLKPQLKL